MAYYVSKVDVRAGDPKKGEPAIVATESILTRACPYKVAVNTIKRWEAIGINNLYVADLKPKKYKKLLREQNKRHKTRQMTKGEVAEILSDES